MSTALEALLQVHREKIQSLNPNCKEWAKEQQIIKQLNKTLALLNEALATPLTVVQQEAEQAYPTQYWEGMEPSATNPRGQLKELTVTTSDLQEAYIKGRTHAPTQEQIAVAAEVIRDEFYNIELELISYKEAKNIASQALEAACNYVNGEHQ